MGQSRTWYADSEKAKGQSPCEIVSDGECPGNRTEKRAGGGTNRQTGSNALSRLKDDGATIGPRSTTKFKEDGVGQRCLDQRERKNRTRHCSEEWEKKDGSSKLAY